MRRFFARPALAAAVPMALKQISDAGGFIFMRDGKVDSGTFPSPRK